MKAATHPQSEQEENLSSIILDDNPIELAMVCLEARDAFEYLALQLETSTGSKFLKEPIRDYRKKARQAEDFYKQIFALASLEGDAL